MPKSCEEFHSVEPRQWISRIMAYTQYFRSLTLELCSLYGAQFSALLPPKTGTPLVLQAGP